MFRNKILSKKFEIKNYRTAQKITNAAKINENLVKMITEQNESGHLE